MHDKLTSDLMISSDYRLRSYLAESRTDHAGAGYSHPHRPASLYEARRFRASDTSMPMIYSSVNRDDLIIRLLVRDEF